MQLIKIFCYELLKYSRSSDKRRNKSVLKYYNQGLGSIFQCKSNNRNKIIGKKHEMKNSMLFIKFSFVILQMGA